MILGYKRGSDITIDDITEVKVYMTLILVIGMQGDAWVQSTLQMDCGSSNLKFHFYMIYIYKP
jgi:hypothetical protein